MKVNEIIFSPTGGTKKVANILSKELGDQVSIIDLSKVDENFKDIKISPDDLSIITLPSYGGRAPKTAIERLKELNGNGASAVIVVAYGNRDYEDTLIELYDSSKEAGFNPIAGVTAVAEHSILPQYATGRPDQEDRKDLIEMAAKIKEVSKDNKPKIPGNRPYKKISNTPLIPKSTKECNNCKICVTVCPVGAIDSNTLKTDKNKCISCMRCIKICPQNARRVNKVLTLAASLALKKSASDRKENELFI